MSLNNEPADILYERNLLVVEQRLLQSSAELAVLGQISLAREMTNLYFAETQDRSACYRTQLRGLNYAWRLTDGWPETITAEEKADETFDRLPWAYEHVWEKIPEQAKVNSDDGLKAFLKLDEEGQGIDEGLRRSTQFKSMHLVRALEMSLAVRNEQNAKLAWMADRSLPASCSDLDPMSKKLCEQIAGRLDRAEQIEYLTRAGGL